MTSLIRVLATHSVPVRQRLFSREVCGGGKLGVAQGSWKFCCLNVEVEKIPERESKRWGDSERGNDNKHPQCSLTAQLWCLLN